MKILPVTNYQNQNFTGNFKALTTAFLFTALTAPTTLSNDVFIKTQPETTVCSEIPEENAVPDAHIKIAGIDKIAKIVVDLNKNLLYKYDKDGNAVEVFHVASGNQYNRTKPGVKVISWVESYPYSGAYGTKRKRNPSAYGPNALILFNIDTETGKVAEYSDGVFIHGTNNPSSIGKYASKGCIRMNNNEIKKLAKEVEKGDIVIFKR